jgi:hypothetical protein
MVSAGQRCFNTQLTNRAATMGTDCYLKVLQSETFPPSKPVWNHCVR